MDELVRADQKGRARVYTFQAIQILIFLIPGFIAAAIMDALIVRAEDSEFRRIVEALILSLIIYTFYSITPKHNPRRMHDGLQPSSAPAGAIASS